MLLALLVGTQLVVLLLVIQIISLKSRVKLMEKLLMVLAKEKAKEKMAGMLNILVEDIKDLLEDEKTNETDGADKHQNKRRPK